MICARVISWLVTTPWIVATVKCWTSVAVAWCVLEGKGRPAVLEGHGVYVPKVCSASLVLGRETWWRARIKEFVKVYKTWYYIGTPRKRGLIVHFSFVQTFKTTQSFFSSSQVLYCIKKYSIQMFWYSVLINAHISNDKSRACPRTLSVCPFICVSFHLPYTYRKTPELTCRTSHLVKQQMKC